MAPAAHARTLLIRVLLVAALAVAAAMWWRQADPGRNQESGSNPQITAANEAPPAGAAHAEPPLPAVVPPGHPSPELTRLGKAALSSLKIGPVSHWDSYRRDAFGRFWSDEVDAPAGRNGCDTRDDVLRRDLVDRRMGTRNRCVVLSGTLHDPYTGKTLRYDRSQRSGIEIDHIVALGAAWRSGAHAWTVQQRLAFANDITNLAAVDRVANQDKRSLTPDRWRPPREESWCDYAARYALTKAKYRLTVTSSERKALGDMLGTCPAAPSS